MIYNRENTGVQSAVKNNTGSSIWHQIFINYRQICCGKVMFLALSDCHSACPQGMVLPSDMFKLFQLGPYCTGTPCGHFKLVCYEACMVGWWVGGIQLEWFLVKIVSSIS